MTPTHKTIGPFSVLKTGTEGRILRHNYPKQGHVLFETVSGAYAGPRKNLDLITKTETH